MAVCEVGSDGLFGQTRADDMAVRTVRALLERNPGVDPVLIEDVVFAATAQVGDQGLTLGRSVAVLAGLPKAVPGYAVDRMCAGALTAIVNAGNAIRVGGQDLVLAGGVEHMGRHPMAAEVDPNPRFLAEGLVDPSALVMGNTAENIHDELPAISREPVSAAREGGQPVFAHGTTDVGRSRGASFSRSCCGRCPRVHPLLGDEAAL